MSTTQIPAWMRKLPTHETVAYCEHMIRQCQESRDEYRARGWDAAAWRDAMTEWDAIGQALREGF